MQVKVVAEKARGRLNFGGSLMDKIVARQVFRHPEAVRAVLEAVYPGKDIRVDGKHIQTGIETREGEGPEGHHFDVVALDSEGNGYDLEFERFKDPDFPLQCRYYLSMLSGLVQLPHVLEETLPRISVIFLFQTDPLGDGLPLYTVGSRVCWDGGSEPFDDGTEAILVNGDYKKPGTAIGDLNRDLQREDLGEIVDEGLRAAVRKASQTEEWDAMVEAFPAYRKKADRLAAEAQRAGEEKERVREAVLAALAAYARSLVGKGFDKGAVLGAVPRAYRGEVRSLLQEGPRA